MKLNIKNSTIACNFTFLLLFVITVFMGGCTAVNKGVTFSSLQWKVNDSTKYIHDTRYNWVIFSGAMEFSERNPIIANNSTLKTYKGLDRYLSEVIEDVPLAIDSILLYLPMQKLIFATYSGEDTHVPPVSYIIFDNTGEEERHFSFLNEYPDESLPRDNKWMFGNVFPNKKKDRCVVAYRFPYNDSKMVVLKIEQGHNREMDELTKALSTGCTCCYPLSHAFIDPLKPEYAEVVGWNIDKAKKTALFNLGLGEKLKQLKKQK